MLDFKDIGKAQYRLSCFMYGIAGKPQNDEIDVLIDKITGTASLPNNIRTVLRELMETAKHGNYPSAAKLEFILPPPQVDNSIPTTHAEIIRDGEVAFELFRRADLISKVFTVINDHDDFKETVDNISLTIADFAEAEADEDEDSPIGISSVKPGTKGIMTGVKAIDDITNGFQEGTIATIAGFTGHGKSTWTNSIIYNNVMAGKKCLLVSLELERGLVWHQFEARYMNQVKGLEVSTTDIVQGRLTPEMKEKIIAAEPDFFSEFGKGLIVASDEKFDKKMLTNPAAITRWLKSKEKKLGSLHLVAFDHVGLFENRFPDAGNQILVAIQNAIKNYVCEDGTKPVCIWCCQANREGNKRARINPQHCYDLQAIADLHEVERSSSYVLFLYTDSPLTQETHITTAKIRLGQRVDGETFVTPFLPEILTVGEPCEDIKASDDFMSDFMSFDMDAAF